ncbi:hypothetical protein BS78_01G262000 [Paspalum vaginatum]|nr:hypothetical protein BS78_01G262000 [Paspalum vaginatum]KAJ1295953.1 hypothetical protein BS78_01G262000 [Paspalum vaginatum]
MSKRLLQACSPAADLQEDLLLDIFLRLPPAPRHLQAASLVCRRWRRLIRNPDFLARFRAFHRATPVLGLYQRVKHTRSLIRFVPVDTPAPRFSVPRYLQTGWCWVLDCRHGRVLVYDNAREKLLVWDPRRPATKPYQLSVPSELSEQENFTAALICAPGHDHHGDCGSSPFQIVYIDNSEDDELVVSACVFSSETRAWGRWTSIITPSLVCTNRPAAIVGGSVYWNLDFPESGNHILWFEMQTLCLDPIELPKAVKEEYMSNIHVMPAEDGGIGFAGVNQSSLHFWSRKTDCEGVAGWELIRKINMETLTISDAPAGDMLSWSAVAGFAEDSAVIFLHSDAGLLMFNLRSMQLKKVPEASASAIYPYTSFYTRGRDIVGIDDKDADIKVSKEEEAGTPQVEVMDKEQAESSTSGDQLLPKRFLAELVR